MSIIQRRTILKGLTASAAVAATGAFVAPRFAIGQTAKIKLGLMLPYTGTYAALGRNIDEALRLAIAQQGGKLGDREIEYAVVDDQSDPPKGAENANKLVSGAKVDILIGTVHSGVVAAMVKVVHDSGTLLIIPNAGLEAATGPLCAPNIFRTSFSNWQPAYAMGKVAAGRGWKRAVVISWDYAAGKESTGGFAEAFTAGGGKIDKELYLPFPQVEFQPLLTEIASLKPDVVYAFFAGGGAVKFLKDYAAAGLRKSVPLVGPGFLTDGTLQAAGDAAQGLETTLHYADGLDLPKDKEFRAAFKQATTREADVYAVQGYDTGQLLVAGLNAVRGNVGAKTDLIAAWEKAVIDSPRGRFTLSKAHNPIQDFYLRKVQGLDNRYVSVAVKALADPARGCKMA
ncbi:MAG TPA: ABC transporter substrate-binding protein [Stellaceae bacterium]|jgi:branched-chain amino acid transport system substrate-binding protein|nr:ABC transporter substrate-binding protein [Stellaceae bacterium]